MRILRTKAIVMKCLSFLIGLVVCFSLKAQITSAEYFIDTDPGVGNGSPITVSGNVIDQDLNVPTTGLTDGVHKLYIRVQNNDGNWSLYDRNVFYINPSNDNTANIAAAEYFIDTDPGVGNGVGLTVAGNVIDQNFNIPTTGLADGVHKLYLRLHNADGSWSLYDRAVFYLSEDLSNTASLSEAEYFFDIDPGIGNGTPITFSETEALDSDFEIDVPNDLPQGDHIVYVRIRNTQGDWSLYAYSRPSTLSTAENVLSNFKMYPIPIRDILTFDTNNQPIKNVKIIDLNGRVVLDIIPEGFKIDLSDLNSGIYLIYLKTNVGSISKKLIKQ